MAAKFTMSYTSDAGNISRDSKSYSEVNGEKFTDWLYASYPTYSEPDENGDVVILPQTPARTAQAFKDWADDEHEKLRKRVVAHFKHAGAQAGAAAVPDIEPEP